MKILQCGQLLAAGLSMMILSGCFGLEPTASSTAEQPAFPSAAKPSASPPAAKPYRTYLSALTCENMIKSLESKEGQERLILVVGTFITGSNYAKGRDVNIDLKTLTIMTENYCRENPKHGLDKALVVVDRSLDRAQVQQQALPWTAVPASAPTPGPAVAPSPVPVPQAAAAPAAAVPAGSPAPAKGPALVPPPPAAPAALVPAAPAKTTAPSAAMPKARADGNYLVQVISTEVEAEANRLINTLRGDKFPAFLERASLGDKGVRYRVVVGPYDDQLAAEKVAALLRERKFQTIVRLRR